MVKQQLLKAYINKSPNPTNSNRNTTITHYHLPPPMDPHHNYLFASSSQESQTKITKTLLLQSLEGDNFSHQYQVSIPYDSVSRQLDMGHVLHEIFFQVLNPHYQYQVFYFSQVNGCFCFGDVYPWTRSFVLGEEFIPIDEIFIAFRKVCLVDGSGAKQTETAKENKKKRRINDRTILETLQKVSLWRSKCQQEKITFQQAAKQIDIPKKTLDDYYALIRTGEQHGFDFEKNYEQKIGVLRQFVKEKHKQNKLIKEKKPQKVSKLYYDQEEKKPESVERKMSIIDKMMLEGDSDDDQQE